MINAADDGEIVIGSDVMIGPYCVLRSADHVYSDPKTPMRLQGHAAGKIVIEDDVWLSSHVVVTRGITIGKGSVIGAQSVVTHDIPPYSIAFGAPARVTGKRGG
jgi:acetyltransferase-like isoleucine patch superfamily enzyme